MCCHIVVGAGSAGVQLCKQLLDKGHDVILIERGPDRRTAQKHHARTWISNLLQLESNVRCWTYQAFDNVTSAIVLQTVPQESFQGRTVAQPQGKGTNGTGNINAQIWTLGHPGVYDLHWPAPWNAAAIDKASCELRKDIGILRTRPSDTLLSEILVAYISAQEQSHTREEQPGLFPAAVSCHSSPASFSSSSSSDLSTIQCSQDYLSSPPCTTSPSDVEKPTPLLCDYRPVRSIYEATIDMDAFNGRINVASVAFSKFKARSLQGPQLSREKVKEPDKSAESQKDQQTMLSCSSGDTGSRSMEHQGGEGGGGGTAVKDVSDGQLAGRGKLGTLYTIFNASVAKVHFEGRAAVSVSICFFPNDENNEAADFLDGYNTDESSSRLSAAGLGAGERRVVSPSNGGEIFLCAGAFESPRILINSGLRGTNSFDSMENYKLETLYARGEGERSAVPAPVSEASLPLTHDRMLMQTDTHARAHAEQKRRSTQVISGERECKKAEISMPVGEERENQDVQNGLQIGMVCIESEEKGQEEKRYLPFLPAIGEHLQDHVTLPFMLIGNWFQRPIYTQKQQLPKYLSPCIGKQQQREEWKDKEEEEENVGEEGRGRGRALPLNGVHGWVDLDAEGRIIGSNGVSAKDTIPSAQILFMDGRLSAGLLPDMLLPKWDYYQYLALRIQQQQRRQVDAYAEDETDLEASLEMRCMYFYTLYFRPPVHRLLKKLCRLALVQWLCGFFFGFLICLTQPHSRGRLTSFPPSPSLSPSSHNLKIARAASLQRMPSPTPSPTPTTLLHTAAASASTIDPTTTARARARVGVGSQQAGEGKRSVGNASSLSVEMDSICLQPLLIDPQYLTDERDVRILYNAYRRARAILRAANSETHPVSPSWRRWSNRKEDILTTTTANNNNNNNNNTMGPGFFRVGNRIRLWSVEVLPGPLISLFSLFAPQGSIPSNGSTVPALTAAAGNAATVSPLGGLSASKPSSTSPHGCVSPCARGLVEQEKPAVPQTKKVPANSSSDHSDACRDNARDFYAFSIYASWFAGTYFHSCGTCRMGRISIERKDRRIGKRDRRAERDETEIVGSEMLLRGNLEGMAMSTRGRETLRVQRDEARGEGSASESLEQVSSSLSEAREERGANKDAKELDREERCEASGGIEGERFCEKRTRSMVKLGDYVGEHGDEHRKRSKESQGERQGEQKDLFSQEEEEGEEELSDEQKEGMREVYLDSVVDTHFRVHGVRGLRVVDASIFPAIPTGPISAVCMALGALTGQLVAATGQPASEGGRDSERAGKEGCCPIVCAANR